MKRALILTALLLLPLTAQAQTVTVPDVMNFQGRLAKPDGTPLPNSGGSVTYNLTFRLYSQQGGGTLLWQQSFTNVTVVNGLFVAPLNFGGGYTAGQSESTAFAAPPYLEIQVNSDTPLSPRQPFGTTAYSLYSKQANTAVSVAAGSIGLNSLTTGIQSVVGSLANSGFALVGAVRDTNTPNHIVTTGSYAYVASSLAGLEGYDVTSLNAPKLLGSANPGAGLTRAALYGTEALGLNNTNNTLYTFTLLAGVPTYAKSIATDTDPLDLAVSNTGYAYVVNANSNDFQVFNIGNPNAPAKVATVATASTPNGVAVSGNYLYVINSVNSELHVWNIATPGSPVSVGATATSGSNATAVAVSGNYAYVNFNSPSVIQVFDISAHANPVSLGTIAASGRGESLAVASPFLFAASATTNLLQVYNISAPASPVLTGTFPLAGNAHTIAASGLSAFAADSDGLALQAFTFATSLTIPNFNVSGALSVGAELLGANGVLPVFGSLNLDSGSLNSGSLANALTFGAGNAGLGSQRVGAGNLNGLDFFTGNTRRVSILSGGNVGIGNTTPAYPLDVTGDINARGAVRANSAALTSDARYKTNVATLNNALDAVLNLRGVSYDWDRAKWPAKNFAEGRQIGFIAQELEKVFPELVQTDSSGYKSVMYQNLTPVLVEAVKNLNAKVDAQQREIEDIKAENAELKKQNAEIASLKKQLALILETLKAQK